MPSQVTHYGPEEENSGCSPDLVVADDVSVLLRYIAYLLQDRIATLLDIRSIVEARPQMRTWHGLMMMLFPVPGTTTGGLGALGRLELAAVEDDMLQKRPLRVAA